MISKSFLLYIQVGALYCPPVSITKAFREARPFKAEEVSWAVSLTEIKIGK